MGSKEIHIKFTKEQIEKYNGQGFKLCFSAGVGENPTFNVIAKADTIAANVAITWTDEFKIAATKSKFQNGVKFDIATNPANIKFDQVYTLPPNWTDGNISDEKLPGKSFKMVNDTSAEAAAVIFKRINGEDLPFYISNPLIDSKGSELMTPKSIAGLWFQANGETGTMVSVNKGDLSIFDFAGQDKINLKWNGAHFVVDDA